MISAKALMNLNYTKKRKRRKTVKRTRPRGLKKVERFHKQRKKISRVISNKIDKREIVYGARALNKRFPSFLDKHTEDWDIFTPHPRRDARETEKALDKTFGGDHFFVKKALHPGTYKVVAHADKEGYADYTKPTEQIPFNVIGGRKYVTLGWVKRRIRKTLADPENKYRHAKDRDALNRIMIYEKMRKRR